jgi:NAD(P)-dependent dehydrogenase (short-subunit alcohol dehydrogenase family)
VARVFIAGSSDGLGRIAAQLLIKQGHGVVLHVRNEPRGRKALSAVSGAETVVIGDLTSIAQKCSVAEQAKALGSSDAVPQCRYRVQGTSTHCNRRGPASCICRQYTCAAHPNRVD